MKVVFLEEVEGTARTGEVKNVADGFARNYLLPRKLAAPATDHYISIAQAKAGKEARRQERLDEETRQHLLPKLDGRTLRMEVRVGEQGKLFGSVTGRDIAERLQEETKVELEHRQVDLNQPLRELGEFQVPVKLTKNVIATITVNIEPLGGLPEEEAESAAETATAEAVAEARAETTEEAAEAEASAGAIGIAEEAEQGESASEE